MELRAKIIKRLISVMCAATMATSTAVCSVGAIPGKGGRLTQKTNPFKAGVIVFDDDDEEDEKINYNDIISSAIVPGNDEIDESNNGEDKKDQEPNYLKLISSVISIRNDNDEINESNNSEINDSENHQENVPSNDELIENVRLMAQDSNFKMIINYIEKKDPEVTAYIFKNTDYKKKIDQMRELVDEAKNYLPQLNDKNVSEDKMSKILELSVKIQSILTEIEGFVSQARHALYGEAADLPR